MLLISDKFNKCNLSKQKLSMFCEDQRLSEMQCFRPKLLISGTDPYVLHIQKEFDDKNIVKMKLFSSKPINYIFVSRSILNVNEPYKYSSIRERK